MYADGPISAEDAAKHTAALVQDAVAFIEAELYDEWEKAERFFSGETDVPISPGRSRVTKTIVRDAIRGIKPSIMRVFLQSQDIVCYEPYNVGNHAATAIARIQTLYATQLFWRSNGYRILLDSVTTALLKGYAIVKVYHEKRKVPTYMRVQGMSEAELEVFEEMDDVEVLDVEYVDGAGYSARIARLEEVAQNKVDTVPLGEFFFDDNATNLDNAVILGQRRSVTVGEAISMGLEYDDWEDLDDLDIAQQNVKETEQKRKYIPRPRSSLETKEDITSRSFLLTEAYAKFDIDGLGVPQYYKFWLGGTNYKYMSHDRVNEHPYALILVDPRPDSFVGNSIFDLLKDDQNAATSLIRAAIDNAHASNNRRLAVHESLVNMHDVMTPVIGHPIRFKQPGMIQEVGVESTLGSMLPLLQYVEDSSNNKAGVTKASLGLDPNALQSTDKDAVKNTIQLSQGQVELMCRNIAETGVTVIFDKLLRLSIMYTSPKQLVEIDNAYYPVDLRAFDPSMHLKASAGLGVPGIEIQYTMLSQILAKQEEFIVEFGLDNPIAPLNMALKTMFDMAKLAGIRNPARYFNEPTPEVVKFMQQKLQERAQAEQAANEKIAALQPQTYIEGEKIKAAASESKVRAELKTEILKMFMNDDQIRDKLLQELMIEAAKLNQQKLDAQAVMQDQKSNDGDKKAPEGLG